MDDELNSYIQTFDHNYNFQLTMKVLDENTEKIMKDIKQYTNLIKIADSGDAEAQYSLAVLLEKYHSPEKNLFEAFKYYKLAADKGHVMAQFNLAYYYRYEEGCTRNLFESFKYFKLAADNGHVEAQYIVASCYKDGFGCNKNIKEALVYYNMASDNGNLDAYKFLYEGSRY